MRVHSVGSMKSFWMLKQMMHILKKSSFFDFTHRVDLYGSQRFGMRPILRLQVKWEEVRNAADP